MEVAQSGDGEELFDEDLRVEDSDVSGPSNHGVGIGRKGMEHVIADQGGLRRLDDGL